MAATSSQEEVFVQNYVERALESVLVEVDALGSCEEGNECAAERLDQIRQNKSLWNQLAQEARLLLKQTKKKDAEKVHPVSDPLIWDRCLGDPIPSRELMFRVKELVANSRFLEAWAAGLNSMQAGDLLFSPDWRTFMKGVSGVAAQGTGGESEKALVILLNMLKEGSKRQCGEVFLSLLAACDTRRSAPLCKAVCTAAYLSEELLVSQERDLVEVIVTKLFHFLMDDSGRTWVLFTEADAKHGAWFRLWANATPSKHQFYILARCSGFGEFVCSRSLAVLESCGGTYASITQFDTNSFTSASTCALLNITSALLGCAMARNIMLDGSDWTMGNANTLDARDGSADNPELVALNNSNDLWRTANVEPTSDTSVLPHAWRSGRITRAFLGMLVRERLPCSAAIQEQCVRAMCSLSRTIIRPLPSFHPLSHLDILCEALVELQNRETAFTTVALITESHLEHVFSLEINPSLAYFLEKVLSCALSTLEDASSTQFASTSTAQLRAVSLFRLVLMHSNYASLCLEILDRHGDILNFSLFAPEICCTSKGCQWVYDRCLSSSGKGRCVLLNCLPLRPCFVSQSLYGFRNFLGFEIGPEEDVSSTFLYILRLAKSSSSETAEVVDRHWSIHFLLSFLCRFKAVSILVEHVLSCLDDYVPNIQALVDFLHAACLLYSNRLPVTLVEEMTAWLSSHGVSFQEGGDARRNLSNEKKLQDSLFGIVKAIVVEHGVADARQSHGQMVDHQPPDWLCRAFMFVFPEQSKEKITEIARAISARNGRLNCAEQSLVLEMESLLETTRIPALERVRGQLKNSGTPIGFLVKLILSCGLERVFGMTGTTFVLSLLSSHACCAPAKVLLASISARLLSRERQESDMSLDWAVGDISEPLFRVLDWREMHQNDQTFALGILDAMHSD